MVLDADLSDDLNLKKSSKLFPNRFIQNGIAEQDMVSMAGGIARWDCFQLLIHLSHFNSERQRTDL